ncbi:sulfur reduction protein DsrE [Gillisia sp. CAL575]|uniref:sulfur reduction protein DsrE n=1 Tax=Gillisia sp. CAL575 TaxID=985255 RepID=UPI0003A1D2E4|nr:sulfur reduction protein DsrE [Gillisia sp. CAL575]
MKTIFTSALLILIGITSLNAQTLEHKKHDSSKNNYVVLTKKVAQLKPIFLAAEVLASEDGSNYGDFQVIICGKTVEDLVNKELMHDFLHQAEKQHISIVACGFSLKKFKVSKDDLPEQVEVVDNGILYDFQLQKKGYYNIAL